MTILEENVRVYIGVNPVVFVCDSILKPGRGRPEESGDRWVHRWGVIGPVSVDPNRDGDRTARTV